MVCAVLRNINGTAEDIAAAVADKKRVAAETGGFCRKLSPVDGVVGREVNGINLVPISFDPSSILLLIPSFSRLNSLFSLFFLRNERTINHRNVIEIVVVPTK